MQVAILFLSQHRLQIPSRPASLFFGDCFGGADGDDFSAAISAFGAKIYNPVGGFNDVQIMLDNDHCIAALDQFIEHGEELIDVIKTADWIIDLGPEGGDGGGEIVAIGTPEKVAKEKRSWTGKYLKPMLSRG